MNIGIDPGLTGAIAGIGDTENRVVDMPILSRVGKKGKQINYHSMISTIESVIPSGCEVDMVYIEQVHAMPKQGVSSSFNFGMSYGSVLTAVASMGLRMTLVTPQSWKKRAGLIRSEKDAARTLAIQLFPELFQELKLKKHIGRADALLIARFGQE